MAREVGAAGRGANPLSPQLFAFLRELQANNDRAWFTANKARYVEQVQEPALAFIAGFAERLHKISPHFVADPRVVGGSLFRIHRDVRFSADKTPYKTHTGIQFRHERGKDAHAPGFYLHLEPGRVFAAAGLWRPDRETLQQVRDAIAAGPGEWSSAVEETAARAPFRLEGEALVRAPAGFDPEHPAIADLKRKDFVLVAGIGERAVGSRRFPQRLADTFGAATPVVRFLCSATGMPF